MKKRHPSPHNEYFDFTPINKKVNWTFVIVWLFILGISVGGFVYLITLIPCEK